MERDPERKGRMIRALEYMGLNANQLIQSIQLDRVFIGSCTNSRIEDLRVAAQVMKGQTCRIPTMIVPGSEQVKRTAESEGLDEIFRLAKRRMAGFGMLHVCRHQWRHASKR